MELLGVCVDAHSGFRAIVLEFCGGGDLKRALRAPPGDVWRWAVQLAEALRYLHASGQVHRDIKGENMLLSGDGGRLAKFGDLGVADADEEFVGDKLGAVRGFSQKDWRWAGPEELAAPQTQVQTEVNRCVCVCGVCRRPDVRCVTQATAVYGKDLAAYDANLDVVGLQNTAAADVFSFGLVLYQLCHGDRAAWWPIDVNDNDVAAIAGALCHPATFAQWTPVDPA